MDKDTLDYILSRMEKQDKGISDLAEKIDELSMKMYSISEELANSKRNGIIRCVADQSDKDRHHVHICILNPINDYLVVG
jgi:DNA-binding HxlR family transcriptional regulator